MLSRSSATILFVFFLKAEDGIRDHCVPGVQTCALPICVPELPPFERGADTQVSLASKTCVSAPRSNGGNSGTLPVARITTSEIGRASCRERVEISVVAGSLKKKKKEHAEWNVQYCVDEH